MPITLEKLFSPTAKFTFPILEETVTVVWAPWRYTAEMQDLADRISTVTDEGVAEVTELRKKAAEAIDQADVAKATGDGDKAAELRAFAKETYDDIERREARLTVEERAGIRAMLSMDGDPPGLLVSWDVLDDDGVPIPPTEAALRKLPQAFLLLVFARLMGESQADPTKPERSDSDSGTEKPSEPSPSGSSSSPEPEPSESAPSTSTLEQPDPASTRSGDIGR